MTQDPPRPALGRQKRPYQAQGIDIGAIRPGVSSRGDAQSI